MPRCVRAISEQERTPQNMHSLKCVPNQCIVNLFVYKRKYNI